ncbi:Beta-galactosidase [Posidoniimonas polymericola]|uniref:Beta-galactosidase n=1 Tax=Posidoniimonas polymericola TaxID=2528002 RepID=A0A5C5YIC1_9BACT|nr:sugar-binding domain-containing protein [Posidoniimonas polymericola]TWT74610.1 Beta-galactosidase [Posidoniimonas polymericola]
MQRGLTFLVTIALASAAFSVQAIDIVDDARYLTDAPAAGWQAPGFDDSSWKEGKAGFGSEGTPGARVGTEWLAPAIWVRKEIKLDKVPAEPVLFVHHDDNAEIYVNGKLAAELKGNTVEYVVRPINADAASALKAGKNVIAIHCTNNNGGGQFIDAHVMNKGDQLDLPQPPRKEHPKGSDLITKWGAEVTPENAWTEYPRPQLERSSWQNLNGKWDYAITPIDQQTTPEKWDGKILVPFCLESKLGGVERLLYEDQALWYHRTFTPDSKGERTLLNFEAVDYRCEVLVNGKSVGGHQGGNLPFTLDVSDALTDGENTLVVRVEDATEEWQLRGKQVRNPNGIWYTRVSGIWQTVWLEQVSGAYVADLTLDSDAEAGQITCVVDAAGSDAKSAQVVVKDGGGVVARGEGKPGEVITLTVADAKLWSPDSPHLYDLEVTLAAADGGEGDSVKSYAGIRDVTKQQDADGAWRLMLNGKEIFHWGPLDQGWWPDGLLTPPSDEAMLWDVEYLKAAGFNMIRKHIKVEPRRYYYHCDRLGVMLWQDQVSGGRSPQWTRMRPNPNDAQWPAEAHQQYMTELDGMIDSLESHPSIVVWVPFNEAWGQHRTVEVGKWTAKRDPSRLVNIASGGNFWPVGDIADQHAYPDPAFPFQQRRLDPFVKVVGEFGGHGWPVKGHMWDESRRNWGYGGLPKDKQEYKQRYERSLDKLIEMRGRGIAGAVYTQTTDVENEINGLVTYDRKEIKFPAEELAKLHKELLKDRQ